MLLFFSPSFCSSSSRVCNADPNFPSQVPDDLVDILNDPSLFSNNGEITTKEILKRFGDRPMNGGARSYGDVTEIVSRHDNSIRPLARRVETDPSLWQDERSVWPMQDPAVTYAGPNNSQNTPPPKWRGPDEGHPSPYGQEFDGPVSQPDGSDRSNPRRDWRNSGWSRENRTVGITGAG